MASKYINDIITEAYRDSSKIGSIVDVMVGKYGDDFLKISDGLSGMFLLDACVSYHISRKVLENNVEEQDIYVIFEMVEGKLGLSGGSGTVRGTGDCFSVVGVLYDDGILFRCFDRVFYVHKTYRKGDWTPICYHNVLIESDVYNYLLSKCMHSLTQILWGYVSGDTTIEDFVRAYVVDFCGVSKFSTNMVINALCDSLVQDVFKRCEVINKDFIYVDSHLVVDGKVYKFDTEYIGSVKHVYISDLIGDFVYLLSVHIGEHKSSTFDNFLFIPSMGKMYYKNGGLQIQVYEIKDPAVKRRLVMEV